MTVGTLQASEARRAALFRLKQRLGEAVAANAISADLSRELGVMADEVAGFAQVVGGGFQRLSLDEYRRRSNEAAYNAPIRAEAPK